MKESLLSCNYGKLKETYYLYKTVYPYIEGKSIIDIGAVQHSIDHAVFSNKPWNHGFLFHYGKEVLGIDIAKDDILKLNSMGFKIIYGDAEKFALNQFFDVVFAGDIIEHLSNPGLFIENAFNHLKEKGTFIIVTPNTFCKSLMCVLKMTNDPGCHSQHTCWFTPRTIKELLGRYNFNVVKIEYFTDYLKKIDPILSKKCIRYYLSNMMFRKFHASIIIIAEKQ